MSTPIDTPEDATPTNDTRENALEYYNKFLNECLQYMSEYKECQTNSEKTFEKFHHVDCELSIENFDKHMSGKQVLDEKSEIVKIFDDKVKKLVKLRQKLIKGYVESLVNDYPEGLPLNEVEGLIYENIKSPTSSNLIKLNLAFSFFDELAMSKSCMALSRNASSKSSDFGSAMSLWSSTTCSNKITSDFKIFNPDSRSIHIQEFEQHIFDYFDYENDTSKFKNPILLSNFQPRLRKIFESVELIKSYLTEFLKLLDTNPWSPLSKREISTIINWESIEDLEMENQNETFWKYFIMKCFKRIKIKVVPDIKKVYIVVPNLQKFKPSANKVSEFYDKFYKNVIFPEESLNYQNYNEFLQFKSESSVDPVFGLKTGSNSKNSKSQNYYLSCNLSGSTSWEYSSIQVNDKSTIENEKFSIQNLENLNILLKVYNKICEDQEWCSSFVIPSRIFKLLEKKNLKTEDFVFVVKSEIDGHFYRASFKQPHEIFGQIIVRFVDYGYDECVWLKNCLFLHKSVSKYPIHAIPVKFNFSNFILYEATRIQAYEFIRDKLINLDQDHNISVVQISEKDAHCPIKLRNFNTQPLEIIDMKICTISVRDFLEQQNFGEYRRDKVGKCDSGYKTFSGF